METDQILDLFNLGETATFDSAAGGGSNGGGATNGEREEDMVDVNGEVKEKGKKGWLDGLSELWDERAYEEEYNLDSFLATMKV